MYIAMIFFSSDIIRSTTASKASVERSGWRVYVSCLVRVGLVKINTYADGISGLRVTGLFDFEIDGHVSETEPKFYLDPRDIDPAEAIPHGLKGKCGSPGGAELIFTKDWISDKVFCERRVNRLGWGPVLTLLDSDLDYCESLRMMFDISREFFHHLCLRLGERRLHENKFTLRCKLPWPGRRKYPYTEVWYEYILATGYWGVRGGLNEDGMSSS